MARVVTVDPSASSGQALNGEAVAYPCDVLQEVRVVNDTVGGVPIVVLWSPGTASALDASSVAGGDDVGAATTFSREMDRQTLTSAHNRVNRNARSAVFSGLTLSLNSISRPSSSMAKWLRMMPS